MRAFTLLALILLAAQIFAAPKENSDPSPANISPNKIIPDSDEKDSIESSEDQASSTTTQNLQTASTSDLELSHSDLVESKVAKEPDPAAATSKDEKLGTADTFPIGFASPNLLPYDAALVSGSYAGDFGLGSGLGLNAPYNALAGRGLYYGRHGGLLGNPLLGAGRGVGYGGYGDLALEELARQRLLLNKERQLRIQEEIHRSGKLLDGPYGGRNPYGGGGYGDAELDAYGGYEDIAIKGTGIDAYPDVDELALKGLGPTGGAFGRSQYPINLNPRFNPYQNLGLGLNGYNQRLGGLGGLGGFNQFGSQGLEYQNILAQQALLAKRRGALGRGYQPDLLDPAYSQSYDAVQQPKPVEAEKPKGKSPYGFYSGSS